MELMNCWHILRYDFDKREMIYCTDERELEYLAQKKKARAVESYLTQEEAIKSDLAYWRIFIKIGV